MHYNTMETKNCDHKMFLCFIFTRNYEGAMKTSTYYDLIIKYNKTIIRVATRQKYKTCCRKILIFKDVIMAPYM